MHVRLCTKKGKRTRQKRDPASGVFMSKWYRVTTNEGHEGHNRQHDGYFILASVSLKDLKKQKTFKIFIETRSEQIHT